MRSPEAGGPTVLIVDDDAVNRKLFGLMLIARGYSVLEAGDGYRGLHLAQSEHPDLIIMDIGLPDLSGLEVTRMLKTDDATRSIPLVIATAFIIDSKDLWASGCDGFIMKPFTAAELLEVMEQAVQRADHASPRVAELGNL